MEFTLWHFQAYPIKRYSNLERPQSTITTNDHEEEWNVKEIHMQPLLPVRPLL